MEDKPFDALAHTLFPLFYTAVPFSLFPFAAFSRQGLETLLPHAGIVFSPGIIIGFFLLIWANDTGAYLSGISLGRTRLMERISPKKTWEGFIGALSSASYAPDEGNPLYAIFEAEAKKVFDRFSTDGVLVQHCATELYLGKVKQRG